MDESGEQDERAVSGGRGVTVWTIGHGNLTWEAFVDRLTGHEPPITRLVDVRSAPWSRFHPQFNRRSLEAGLEDAGIAYHFAGDYLGGRPTDPSCYLSGEVPTGKADYLNLVDYPAVARKDWFLKGLTRLIELAEERPTAIMCSESDPLTCHRHHLIAKALGERQVTVVHLRRDGSEQAATFGEPAGTKSPTQLMMVIQGTSEDVA